MAPINGPDLILDVIRARPNEDASGVSPSSGVRAGAAQLVSEEAEVAFEQAVRNAAAGEAPERGARSSEPMMPPLTGMQPHRTSGTPQTPASMLQGLLLKSVVEVMLPKEGGSFFGGGTAGSVWRSMLAQHVADQLNQKLELQIIPQAGERRPEPVGGEGPGHSQKNASEAIFAGKPRVRES